LLQEQLQQVQPMEQHSHLSARPFHLLRAMPSSDTNNRSRRTNSQEERLVQILSELYPLQQGLLGSTHQLIC
jgi:hypothetical protein